MSPSAGTAARTEITGNPQERNKAWWERLPMTYEDWEANDRSTTRDRVVARFLDSNPFLTPDYFLKFAGRDVLEIGCGAGPATFLFSAGGANVTAIDLTAAAVALAKQTTNGRPATILQMDAEKLAFPDASFDHVFSWGVLHHSANPEAAYAQVVRVLKPGGTALIMVYNRASLRYWLKGAYWLFLRGRIFAGDNFASVQRFFCDGYYHKHYTRPELRAALAPLLTERMSITHMSPRMIPLVPRAFDEFLKRHWGWLLVAECKKPGP